MLRVGLTGGLGSGKSTVAAMLADLGAHVISADELGRQMMQPGEAVYRAIIDHFGSEILDAAGALNRSVLARISFAEGRVAELNAIVHPAVIARQAEMADDLAQREPDAVLIVESALLFETDHAGEDGWRSRFDTVLLVTASEGNKVQRFVDRTEGTSPGSREDRAIDARHRLARQIEDAVKRRWADFAIENDGSLEELQRQVEEVWRRLSAQAQGRATDKGRGIDDRQAG